MWRLRYCMRKMLVCTQDGRYRVELLPTHELENIGRGYLSNGIRIFGFGLRCVPRYHLLISLLNTTKVPFLCLTINIVCGSAHFKVSDILSDEFRQGVDHKISHFLALAPLVGINT